ncbi:MAG: hypothetical protein K2Y37_15170 [Pirellulales bacterium]|nr:hypothetical protein [Pirellulales bacterium]
MMRAETKSSQATVNTARLRHERYAVLVLCVSLFGLMGSSCPNMVRQYRLPAAAQPLPQAATLEQIAAVVNDNSARVAKLSSSSATLSSPQFPTLRASLAVERPLNFRLIAEKTALTGAELDLGSNEELFWCWVQRSDPRVLYFCRHEQFGGSAARQMFPVEPQWLVEALGLVTFVSTDEHREPQRVGRGRLRIESTLSRPEGLRRRVVEVDEATSTVVATHLYDEAGRLLASALLSGHERDETSGAVLPRQIEIRWPASRLEFTLALDDVVVNQIQGDPVQLFAKPSYQGSPEVDLADPNVPLPVAGATMTSGMPVLSTRVAEPAWKNWFRR